MLVFLMGSLRRRGGPGISLPNTERLKAITAGSNRYATSTDLTERKPRQMCVAKFMDHA